MRRRRDNGNEDRNREEEREAANEGGRGGGGGRNRRAVRSAESGDFLNVRIPKPTLTPELKTLRLGNEPRIYFDLETTGFGHDSHIIQLAASGPSGEFLSYVQPRRPISRGASEVTGIRLTPEGVLTHHGRPVEAPPLRKALGDFLSFVRASGPPRALLVAHNARNFDSRVLVTSADNIGLRAELEGAALGFLDSLRLFRELYPRRRSHRLGALHKTLIGGSFDAHDALEDTRALRQLVEKEGPSKDALERHTFEVSFVRASLAHLEAKKDNLETLQPLEGVVSDSMMAKMAASGLRLEHLRAVHARDPTHGVRDLFVQPLPDGKARVTRVKSIAAKVTAFLDSN